MTELEKKIIDAFETRGWPSLSFCGISIKDMTRNELELLCILLGHESLQKAPIIEVSLIEN